MSNTIKLITDNSGLIIALVSVAAVLGFGRDTETVPYQTIILDSEAAYDFFLKNHPAK